MRFLEGRAEDAEGRSRRSNLRIVGLPEGEEGRDPLTFLEKWIKGLTTTVVVRICWARGPDREPSES